MLFPKSLSKSPMGGSVNMVKYRVLNPEVLYSTDAITCVLASDIAYLKSLALENPRKRIRLCSHASEADMLHEMLIVMYGGCYVQPHAHPGKSEAFHVIDGLLTVVIFDQDGVVQERVEMGAFGSTRPFYYRLSSPLFHTVIIESECAVFHEVTNGPFRPGETKFAQWAPAEGSDEAAKRLYQNKIMGL
jgi:cupin fold WbuC family metalloprotein